MDQTQAIGAQGRLGQSLLTRRKVVASGLAATGMGAMLASCAQSPAAGGAGIMSPPPAYGFGALKPLDLNPANLIRITVCQRPFRPAGPRLEVERVGQKALVHNYGHGGSGWSLAWGYAEAARDLVAKAKVGEVSVLGAGAIGLTTAIAIAETGAQVTIFAREMPAQAASSKATGVWSPSSRIAMAGAAHPGFASRWEALARRSYARHLTYAGRSGFPVEFTPRFFVRSAAPEPPLATAPEGAARFLHLGRNLRGLAPPWTAREVHPFPTHNSVRAGSVMTFNIAEYTRQLVQDFLAMGGRIERAEIASKDALMELPGEAIVNCAGIGAKSLVSDETLTPVRGQIAWMPAQTDRLYGLYHRGVMALSRRDGLLIQETGGSDFYGLGDSDATPDRDEFLSAHAKIAPLLEWS